MIKKTLFFLLLITSVNISLWLWKAQQIRLAPPAIFKTITGKKIELAQLQGYPVIITFWATDCASCIKEIPHLIDLYQQFHPKGLEIIAVAMYYDPPSHIVEMTKAKQLPYPVALDLKAHHANAFGHVKLTPTTFLISPSGQIIMQTTGLFDMNKIKQKIQYLLKG